jgi:hypothetical protein
MNKLIINQDVLLRTPMKATIFTEQQQGPIHEIEKLLFMWIKMIKRSERLKNTVNKYMTDIRPDRLLFYLVCEAIGTAATPGLLCQPRVMVKMIVEKQMECRVCRGNRSSRRKPAPAPLLSITKFHMTRPWF